MTPLYKPIRNPWIAGGFVLVALLGAWTAPVSPLALSRADVALGQGYSQLAVDRYDAVARWSWMRSHRRYAQIRSAHLLSNELGDPAGALERLEQVVEDPSLPAVERARVQAKMAEIHRVLRAPKAAAHAFMQAVASCRDLEPSDVDASCEAARWKLAAANEFAQAGHQRRALNLLARVVREHPEFRQQANLERAQIQLSAGKIADALTLFEDVSSGTGERANVAKLGVATCLERLGNLDEALAEIDAADLPDAVRESRTQPLRSRARARD